VARVLLNASAMSTTRRHRGNAWARILRLALVAIACTAELVTAEPHGPNDRARSADIERRRSRTVSLVMRFIGVPYAWGGESTAGFDCSGLVKYVYALAGITMPHNAAQQNKAVTPIKDASQLQAGDLVFLQGTQTGRNGHFVPPGEASHVGVFDGAGNVIHASSKHGKVISVPLSSFTSSNFLGFGRPKGNPLMASQTRSIPAENPATSAATTGKHFEGDTVFGLHCTAGTVRGWRRPMANTQIVPTTAVAAIGIMASGKRPVSAWIQPTR